MMRTHSGLLTPGIMLDYPSGTGTRTFSEWIPNHAGLEQVLGVAGFLAPDFYEVRDHLFWDRGVAERFESKPFDSPFGADPSTVERYYNALNLGEFFLQSADAAVESRRLVDAFGRSLEYFWGMALANRFPARVYCCEVACDLYDEEGLCFTFWQRRD